MQIMIEVLQKVGRSSKFITNAARRKREREGSASSSVDVAGAIVAVLQYFRTPSAASLRVADNLNKHQKCVLYVTHVTTSVFSR